MWNQKGKKGSQVFALDMRTLAPYHLKKRKNLRNNERLKTFIFLFR